MVKAAPTGDASLARLTTTATTTIAIRVHKKVKLLSLIFCRLPAFKSAHLTVFGSAASLTFNTCLPRNKNFVSERALVSFLEALTALTVRDSSTFLFVKLNM